MKKIIASVLLFSSLFSLAGCGSENYGEEIEYAEFKSAQEAVNKSSWAHKGVKLSLRNPKGDHVFQFKKYPTEQNWRFVDNTEITIEGHPNSTRLYVSKSNFNSFGYLCTVIYGNQVVALWSELPADPSDLGADLYGAYKGEYTHKFYKDETSYTVVASKGRDKNVYKMTKDEFVFIQADWYGTVSANDKYKDGYHTFDYTIIENV